MTTKTRRQRLKDCVDRLSGKTLQQAEDFIHWLSDRESWEATQELLAIPGFVERYEEAKREIAAGDVVPWEEVKRRGQSGHSGSRSSGRPRAGARSSRSRQSAPRH